jgi:chromosome segregation ATPase
MVTAGLLALLISVAIFAAGYMYLRSTVRKSLGGTQSEMIERIRAAQAKLKDLMQYINSYGSRAQYQTLSQMLEQAKIDLEHEKGALKEIEVKLDAAQKTVEEKESVQQDLKSAKEEDEIALQGVMEAYGELSQECISLEQQLASSLKELDKILAEAELTADQKTIVEDLSKALTTAGSLFRDLITEYAAVNSRLEMLRQQHQDLEDEYTKLVEQQLGE